MREARGEILLINYLQLKAHFVKGTYIPSTLCKKVVINAAGLFPNLRSLFIARVRSVTVM